MKFVIMLSLLLTSCGHLVNKANIQLRAEKAFFIQTEESGTYEVLKEHGFSKDGNFVTKTSIAPVENKQLIVEKNITISKKSKLGSEGYIFTPEKSEATYLLDGQKYLTQIDLDYKKEVITINMTSPEEQWNGVKTFTIPKNNGAICFYAAVVECAIVSTFITKAIENNGGDMNFMLVWEGYPYFQEQFLNIPSTPITDATLSFDGKNGSLYRFILTAAGQSQFFMVSEDGKIENHIWSSQAYNRTRRQ